jgi:hypothetical protein
MMDSALLQQLDDVIINCAITSQHQYDIWLSEKNALKNKIQEQLDKVAMYENAAEAIGKLLDFRKRNIN